MSKSKQVKETFTEVVVIPPVVEVVPPSPIAAALTNAAKENVTLLVVKALTDKRWMDAIKLLEDGKIDENFHTTDSSNLLHIAATSGNLVLIKALVDKGVSLTETNIGMDFPEDQMRRQGHCSKGHREVVTWLSGRK